MEDLHNHHGDFLKDLMYHHIKTKLHFLIDQHDDRRDNHRLRHDLKVHLKLKQYPNSKQFPHLQLKDL